MAITLKDVASVAGVSTATVSRALAGSERVAPQTADHIRMIADDLGYRFDNVARALRQKRSNLVGMVVPDYAFPYAHDFLFALNQELFRDEYVLASVTSFGSTDHEFVQVERLLGQRMDALLIVPADPTASADAISIALDEEIPVFQLHRPVPNRQTATFTLDYEAGIDFALRFCDFRPGMTIQYFCDAASFAADLKRDAFLSVMARRAIDTCQVHCLDPAGRQGRPIVASLANTGEAPRLIICDSFPVAESVAQFYSSRFDEVFCPSVVCLDAIPAKAAPCVGKVLAIDYPIYELASLLVAAINRAINDEPSLPEPIRLQPFINLSRAVSYARPLNATAPQSPDPENGQSA